MERIILASQSPRRRELLGLLGLTFEVIPAKGEEQITTGIPKKLVEDLARQKAEEVFLAQQGDVVVIGSDTVVSTDTGVILGKPKNREDSRKMLALLSGKGHSVSTGVAVFLRKNGQEIRESFVSQSRVFMQELSTEEIMWYSESGECDDKAGAYAVQGLASRFISRIEGDYFTIVGLPVHELYKKLKEMKIISV